MHRHGYKGKKFNRETDQRQALIMSLAESLVKYGSIETTLTKAKAVVPYVEQLITKAKIGDLHNRRLVISGLQTIESAHKLVDEIAPKLKGRNSGHLKIEKTGMRRGDNAETAKISFVDDLTKNEETVKPKDVETKAKPKTQTAPKPKATKDNTK